MIVKYYLFFGYYHIVGSNLKFKTVKQLKEFAKSKVEKTIDFQRLTYK